MRPKSEIYTPKRDDEHPHPFHMRSPPSRGSEWTGQDRIGIRISALLSTERLQTRVYNDNKDFRAIITEVYICKIYTTIKQGYI